MAYQMARLSMTFSEFEDHCCSLEWQNASHSLSPSAELLVDVIVDVIASY